jgi:hypothetical protein
MENRMMEVKNESRESSLDRLVMKLREGFTTCNSKPGGPYSVSVEFDNLEDAHELHRALCRLKMNGS